MRARQWRKLQRFIKRSRTIIMSRSVAAAMGRFMPTPTCSSALLQTCSTALRFTPKNGSIQIALSKHDADFEVAVSDNGCGIAPEHLPRVFDRFYRAESSRGFDGAGLGLALVKSIVDLHGGSTSIHSEIGRGTTVTLTFPPVA